MTEEELTEFLKAAMIDSPPGTKYFRIAADVVERVRAGEVVETEHFRLIETQPGIFTWVKKEPKG